MAFIEDTCEDGKEYIDCANQCDLTCRHKAGVDECVSDGCQPGCRCALGMLLDDEGHCVEECPCYDDETSYAVGEEMPTDTACEYW